jgi:inosose dehydratase
LTVDREGISVRIGYQANAWGGVVGHPQGVTSIKDLWYLTPGDTLDTLGRIGATGYEGVELFDGNLVEFADDPDKLSDALSSNGLTLVGVYSGANFVFPDVLEEELWRVRRAAELGAQFGASQLVVGGGAQRVSPPTDEDYARLAAGLDRVVSIASEFGLTPTYHPHLSTIVEGPEQVDRVFAQTGIGFCPDLGHLVAAGGDAIDLVTRYADRIPYIHYKDVTADGAFVPLGSGVIDFAGVTAALREADYDGWIVIELDGYDGDPDEAARANLEYVRALLAS